MLRGKVLAGDEEAAVIGECFTALLSVQPDESIGFVARYLQHSDEELRELAALALGESRLPGALPHLEAAWTAVLLSDGFRRALLRAALDRCLEGKELRTREVARALKRVDR